MQAFHEMTQWSVLAARKQKSDDKTDQQTQEKRASMSLRKGASVGKKLKVAMPSLTPGGGGGADTAGGSGAASSTSDGRSSTPQSGARQAQQTPMAVQSGTFPTAPVPSSVNTPAVPVKASSSSSSPIPPAYQPHVAQKKINTAMSHATGNSVASKHVKAPGLDGAVQPGAIKQRKPTTGSKSSKSNSRAGTSSATSAAVNLSSLPLHMGISESGAPVNRLAQAQIVIPEALSLRKRRNAIKAKLDALHQKRMNVSDGLLALRKPSLAPDLSSMTSPSSSTKPTNGGKSGSGTGTSTSARAATAARNAAAIVAAAKRATAATVASAPMERGGIGLPQRRKTRWDRVLEEMRWLATDFVEERKWKHTAARMVSNAVKVTAADRKRFEPLEVRPGNMGLMKDARRTNDLSFQSAVYADTPMDDIAAESGKGSTKRTTATALRGSSRYSVPSANDRAVAKRSALIVSDMMSKAWDGVIHADDQEEDFSRLQQALQSHQQFRKTIQHSKVPSSGGSHLDTYSVGMMQPKQAGEEEVVEKGTELNEKTSRKGSKESADSNEARNGSVKQASTKEIQAVLSQRVKSLQDRISRKSRQRGRPPKSTPNSHGLSNAEKKALQFADLVFKSHDGIVVPSSSTVNPVRVVRALLTREGPHLIICSTSMVVSLMAQCRGEPRGGGSYQAAWVVLVLVLVGIRIGIFPSPD